MEDETYTVSTARSWWRWDGGDWLPLDEDQLATIKARMNNQLQTQVDAAIRESLWPGLREATVKLPAPDGVFELLRTLIGRIPLYRLECLLATEAEQREWQSLSEWGEAVTLPLARMQPGWYYRVVDQAGTMPPVYLIPQSGGKILLGRLPGGPDPDLRWLPTRPAPPPADLTHDQS